ncbi:MAG: NAD(P)-dependent oxidoreductase, partial [Kiritimatiellia bacterium]
AALDVFEVEPLAPDHPLRGLPNCLLFPHDGGPTADYRWRCGANAVDQVERFLKGQPLKYIVTLEHYDRMT